VTCKIDKQGTTYYYDTNDNYYRQAAGDDHIFLIQDAGLKAEPVLTLYSSSESFSLIEEQPTRYAGTLADASGYINKLKLDGYSVEIREATPTLLDIYAKSDEYSVRLIFLQDDVIRIYCVNKNGVSCVAPYI